MPTTKSSSSDKFLNQFRARIHTQLAKLQQTMDTANELKQRHKTAVNKIETVFGKIAQKNDHTCVGKEDEVFMVTIPEDFAIFLDKKCYHAEELWKWVSNNDTVPHTRRKLTKRELERIKQKALSGTERRRSSKTAKSSSSVKSAKSSLSSSYASV